MTPPAATGGIPWRLVVALVALHLASSPWTFPQVSDGRATLATARALVTTGSLAIDNGFAVDDGYVPSAKIGTDGRAYAKYGVGAALAYVPAVVIAEGVSRAFGTGPALATAITFSFLNPLLVGATLVLVYALARRVGVDHGGASLAVVALGVGSFAWWLAVSDTSEPLQMLLVVASTAVVLDASSLRHEGREWTVGVLLGALVLVRVLLVVTVPAFLAVGTWRAWRQRRSPSDAAHALVRLSAPLVAAGVLLLLANTARWGHPFDTGYAKPMMTSTLADGLYGLVASPTKGIVFYAPFVVLALPGLVALRRRAPDLVALVAAAVVPLLLATAIYFEWGGGWCWGPRYLSPVLPLLVVAGAAVVRGPWTRVAAAVLVAAGIGINGLGVVVSEDAYRRTVMHAWHWYLAGTIRAGTGSGRVMDVPRHPEDILPAFSSIAGHWWLARVAWSGCDCAQGPVRCACVLGAFEENEVFRSPPWRSSHARVAPAPPWGESIVQPALLQWVYHRAVVDPER